MTGALKDDAALFELESKLLKGRLYRLGTAPTQQQSNYIRGPIYNHILTIIQLLVRGDSIGLRPVQGSDKALYDRPEDHLSGSAEDWITV